MIVFGRPSIEQSDIDAVVDVLKSGWIGTGPRVTEFENIFKAYTGAEHAIALNSCTAGLHLALKCLNLQPGDEVITSPFTFCATANAIIHAGGKPVFVDIDSDTYNINPKFIEKAITEKTRAIVPVHFAGLPCDMDKIMDIAQRYGLYVIEDAAHCIEGYYKGQKIGNIGDATVFSFYVTKNITTAEGGMVTTNRKEWSEKIKTMALHGMTKDAWKRYSDEGYKHYEVVYPGFKYNMTDIAAAMGIEQMKRINKMRARRREIWMRYDSEFNGLEVKLQNGFPHNMKHAYHLYTLELITNQFDRDGFISELYKRGIGTGVHFKCLLDYPYYKIRYKSISGYGSNYCVNASHISKNILSLPLSANLTDDEVDHVVRSVKEIFNGQAI